MSELNYDIYPAEAKSKYGILKLNNEAFPAEARQNGKTVKLSKQFIGVSILNETMTYPKLFLVKI